MLTFHAMRLQAGPAQMSLQDMLAAGATPEQVYQMALALQGGGAEPAAAQDPDAAARGATPSDGPLKAGHALVMLHVPAPALEAAHHLHSCALLWSQCPWPDAAAHTPTWRAGQAVRGFRRRDLRRWAAGDAEDAARPARRRCGRRSAAWGPRGAGPAAAAGAARLHDGPAAGVCPGTHPLGRVRTSAPGSTRSPSTS